MSKVWCVQGIGYGDEGKGGVVDFLTRREKASIVCRFNGGAQAGHHVITDDGRQHTFSQFGSGTFAGARTFLSRFMLVNPYTLGKEARHLESLRVRDPLSLLTIENRALITTPFHMAANRIREMARTARHGSCGMGIGETMDHAIKLPADAYYVRDLFDLRASEDKLQRLRGFLVENLQPLVRRGDPEMEREWDILVDFHTTLAFMREREEEVLHRCHIVDSAWLPNNLYNEPNETVIFEGAQGVLLDQDYGFAPYTTWTDCTFGNADTLLGGSIDLRCNGQHVADCQCNKHSHDVTRVGVLRGYLTRHGAGPLVTEDVHLTSPGENNAYGPWQHRFRRGHFDVVAVRYALNVVGRIDQLALTCLDHLQEPVKSCVEYRWGKDWVGSMEVRRPVDLNHQADIAADLLSTRVEPVYESLPTVNSFIDHVEEELKVPVKITSFGPTASDKRPR